MNSFRIPNHWLNQDIHVAMAGCGGTGSEMLDELFRIHSLLVMLGGKGIQVTAYDPDRVSPFNVGRQRFWHCDVGLFKAETLVTRYNNFAGVNWRYSNTNFSVDDLSDDFDLVITCVDTPSLRASIGEWGMTNDSEMFWLDCGNGDYSGNIIFGSLGNDHDSYLPNVFDLYPVLSEMNNTNTPSCSTQEALARQDYGINRSVAREAGNILWKLVRHGEISYHGSYVDIHRGSVVPLMIDAQQWAIYGYKEAS